MANSRIYLDRSGRGLSPLERKTTVTKSVHTLPRVPGAQLPLERTRNANFAKRLAKIMADRELTQSKVAAEIWGRSYNAKGAKVANGRDRLSVWVSGKNFPDRENLEKLARALKVDVSDLAPDAELRAAHHGAASWSMTEPADDPGFVFVQIAQRLPMWAAHKIQGVLLEAKDSQEKTTEGHDKTRTKVEWMTKPKETHLS
jgi:transcriptional regulator with XRE-family HTH domain